MVAIPSFDIATQFSDHMSPGYIIMYYCTAASCDNVFKDICSHGAQKKGPRRSVNALTTAPALFQSGAFIAGSMTTVV